MERGTALLEGRGTGRRATARSGFVLLAGCLGSFLLAGAATPALAKPSWLARLALSFMSESQTNQALLSSGDVAGRRPIGSRPQARPGGAWFGGGPVLTDPRRVSTDAEKKDHLPCPQRDRQGGAAGPGRSRLWLTAKARGSRRKRKKGKSPKGRATLTQSVPQCDCSRAQPAARSSPAPIPTASFPFPSDHYTVADSGTRHRTAPQPRARPRPGEHSDIHINPADINRSDGFSPGESIVTGSPGSTTRRPSRNGSVPLTDMARHSTRTSRSS